jgi:uncharacterized protein YjbJ (UPF0337 family)
VRGRTVAQIRDCANRTTPPRVGDAGCNFGAGAGAGVIFQPTGRLHPWVRLASDLRPRSAMNSDITKGNWKIAKGKLKQRWSELTDDDVTYVEGKEDELFGRIQRRTGQTREEIERYLRNEHVFDLR